ncbi:NAD(P)-binding protein [Amycolatopsis sp. FBCC-B4732]|uniref:FAD-dependent oxidoreductase n=1 Tax=Amycolatopsis sp. FBCC-B4732 TaxID=3079339 RepID=UPI001FF60323|nr:FAD-dependent oxidoreductase [Amycolatopsis sp. FBCC-B4732]UOX85607.1 NAD(P)-binding protein [Amycolatopsis sp. FBCC-B4732]
MNRSTLYIRNGGPAGPAAGNKVAVVGGGLAGLAAATLLAAERRWEVTVFEKNEVFGGRAAEGPGEGEHCTRLLLPDYDATRQLLARVPGARGHTTVADSITPVRRMEWGPRGEWIEIDHLNRFRASGLSLRDRWTMYRRGKEKPLVAAAHGPNLNVFGSWRQYSIASAATMIRQAWRTDRVYAFPGSTDHFLVAPLRRHLQEQNVRLNTNHEITRLSFTDQGDDVYDAVVLALFPSDLGVVLDSSRIAHRLPASLRHSHCKVLTVELDGREQVLADSLPQLYCRAGIAILVQPAASRCVVLCTKSVSTDDAYVLELVRLFLLLQHGFGRVRVRDNLAPGAAVWSATMPKAAKVLAGGPAGVSLAGSWLASGYPYDSAESAIRSAQLAVEELNRAVRNRLTTP